MTAQTTLKARPTTYNGIQMRSRLEARVAAWLDSIGVQWDYEPQAFADKRGQYLPDFELIRPTGSSRTLRTFLEAKGDLDPGDAWDREQLRMETILESVPRCILILAKAEHLEYGYAEVRWPDGRWHAAVVGSVLLANGFGQPCEHWRLPRWNE